MIGAPSFTMSIFPGPGIAQGITQAAAVIFGSASFWELNQDFVLGYIFLCSRHFPLWFDF